MVVHHGGSSRRGHYTAMVRSGGLWFSCNDEFVRQIDQRQVEYAQGYLLFYEKEESKVKQETPKQQKVVPTVDKKEEE